jgi:putative ABC transport system permease protein
MDTLRQDVKYGCRMLLKRPAITCAAVLSLALGIGINTAIFSLVDTILLGRLSFASAERVVAIRTVPPGEAARPDYVSVPDYMAWQRGARAFDALGSMYQNVRYFGADENGSPAERLDGEDVTPQVFQAIGARPLMGRVFQSTEDEVDHPAQVLIISYGLWQSRFGGDPGILTRSIVVDGLKTEIIGVMPPHFRLTLDTAQYWAPMRFSHFQVAASPRFLLLVGRLRQGVSLGQAQSEIDALAAQSARDFPTRDTDHGRAWGARVIPIREELFGAVARPLLLLQGVVCFVLLIACANVAALLLARVSARQTEIAVRGALGAGRWRLAQQFLTESVLLSSAGGVCGIVFAWAALRALVVYGPPAIPRLQDAAIDTRVLLFSALVSLLTGVVFGVGPAFHAMRAAGGLRAANRGGTPNPSRSRLQGALVVLQIAMALVLLTGAGLLVRSFLQIQRVPLGSDPSGVLTFGIRFPPTQFSSPAGNFNGATVWTVSHVPGETIKRMLERMPTVPGVVSAAGTLIPPMSGEEILPFTIDGRPAGDANAMNAAVAPITPGYFATLRIAMLNGRDFDRHDTLDSPWVAIVNETMATRFWPNERAIGKRVRLSLSPNDRPREIIAVVHDSVATRLQTAQTPTLYVPYVQMAQPILGGWRGWLQQMAFVVRTSGEPTRTLPALQRAMAEIDPNRPMVLPKTIEQAMAEEVAYPRYYSLLLGVFSVVALVLASIGLYGVMMHAVLERTREIGIRLALGATRRDVVHVVAARAAMLVVAGIATGLAAAALLTRFISSQLWEVKATDPATFAVVSVLMIAVALAACLVPTLRATRVDPTIALRS